MRAEVGDSLLEWVDTRGIRVEGEVVEDGVYCDEEVGAGGVVVAQVRAAASA